MLPTTLTIRILSPLKMVGIQPVWIPWKGWLQSRIRQEFLLPECLGEPPGRDRDDLPFPDGDGVPTIALNIEIEQERCASVPVRRLCQYPDNPDRILPPARGTDIDTGESEVFRDNRPVIGIEYACRP